MKSRSNRIPPVAVRRVVISGRRNGYVQLNRIDSRMECSVRHTTVQQVAHHIDESAAFRADAVGLLQMPRPTHISAVDKCDELRIIEIVIPCEPNERF